MTTVALPSVPYKKGNPRIVRSNSQPKVGTRAVASIVIQGNADRGTVEEFKRFMDERDSRLNREMPKIVDGRQKISQTRKVRA